MARTSQGVKDVAELHHGARVGGVIIEQHVCELIVGKFESMAAEAAEVQALVEPLREYMEADVQYKISDLVLGVLGIKAPCHGYAETAEERKHRDGVAKPRIIGALEILGASKYGSGAQTRYSFGEAAPEFEVNAETEEESAES